MSTRTTEANVEGIIEVDSSIDLTPFIATGSALVDEVANASYCDLDSDRLELIERWLSAHFYTMRDPRPVEEKAGSVWVTHQSKVDLNLATSHYGQTAMVLDTTGTLRALSKGTRRISVSWLGEDEEEDEDTEASETGSTI